MTQGSLNQGQVPAAKRRGWAQLRGMKWWEIVLSLLPMGLLLVGGLIGALIGAGGVLVNLAVGKSKMPAAAKVPVMIVVVIVTALIYLGVAVLIASAIQRA